MGVVLPETGEASAYGASIKSGVTLAFEELRASDEALQSLEVTYRDSGSDPARAASVAEGMFERGALLVIGGVTSAEAKAMIPVADRFKRILLSPSASAPSLARLSTYFFRVFPSDELEGVAAADYLLGGPGVRNVLVVSEASEYTRGLLPVFVGELQGRGGQVVATVGSDDPSWEAGLRSALSQAHPEGVYVCGYDEFSLRVLVLLRGVRFGGTVCTTSAVQTVSLLQRAGDVAEGVVFPLAGFDEGPAATRTQPFFERYRRTYNLQPDIYAGHGYDAALAAGLAVAALGGESPTTLRARLRSLSSQVGVMGPLAFDELGNARHALGVYQIRKGRVEQLGRPTRSVAP